MWSRRRINKRANSPFSWDILPRSLNNWSIFNNQSEVGTYLCSFNFIFFGPLLILALFAIQPIFFAQWGALSTHYCYGDKELNKKSENEELLKWVIRKLGCFETFVKMNKNTLSGRFSAAMICFILSSRPLRTAHIRSSRVTSSIWEMYFLLQYLSEVSSMYFSPCSFARFRFSSRSAKPSYSCSKTLPVIGKMFWIFNSSNISISRNVDSPKTQIFGHFP